MRNQSVHKYHPHFTPSQTLLCETVAIMSDEQVVTFASQPDCWYVASKVNQYHKGEKGFTPRYYKMALIEGKWHCSSQDERTQAYCRAAVEAFWLREVA